MASEEAQKSQEGQGVRQNYHPDCEKALNVQIGLELEAMYTYISMASYFSRHDQALPGFAQYFSKSVQEELGHVQLLCQYQNKRGGRVEYKDIKKPAKDEWGSGEQLCQLPYLLWYLWIAILLWGWPTAFPPLLS